MFGYCALCRAKELELYDTLVYDQRHFEACRDAGCKHPPAYPDITANVKYEDEQPVVWDGAAFVSMESYCSDRNLVLLGIIDNSAAEWFDTALFSRKER